jgi:nucleoside-diphosphate-sugar epimerase
VEQALNKLTDVNIVHLRPAYFYQNLMVNFGMIKHAGIIGGNFGDDKLPMIHPGDIAAVAAEILQNLNFKGHTIRYIVGDERTGKEIAFVLGNAVGKPDLPWIVFSDDQNLQGAVQAGLPEEVAKNYTEMGHAIRTGAFYEEYDRPKFSNTKLEDFAKEFADAYHAA